MKIHVVIFMFDILFLNGKVLSPCLLHCSR